MNKTFIIKCTMKTRWIPHFLSALKYMESCGNVGRSCKVVLYADGDGDFQPKFDWDENLDDKAEPIREEKRNRLYDAG